MIPLTRLSVLTDSVMALWPNDGPLSNAPSMDGLTANELVWLALPAILAELPTPSRQRLAKARRGLARHAQDDQEIVCLPIGLTMAELMALFVAGETYWRGREGQR